MSTSTLRLGTVDKGATPSDIKAFLSPYHAVMVPALQNKLAFRDEGNGTWRKFQEIEGHSVKSTQQFLHEAGFMPRANFDGIYGYVTHAAVRLFQEYVRTVDGDESIGTPDGIAGRNTFRMIEKWKSDKKGSPNFVCDWGRHSAENPTEEFSKWISLLSKAKSHFVANPHHFSTLVENFPKASDTLKTSDWDVSPNTIHLIGVRRNQDTTELKRGNDDLFVLLLNGMVFKFWGSTDPSQAMAGSRKDEPFLVEGQHRYRFGWHKISNELKIYRALKPLSRGVLVFRDTDNSNSLSHADIVKGLDPTPNLSINIHWSGKGHTNYSAGCQVIAGESYINHKNEAVDCAKFASRGYAGLSQNQTRGAYNVLTDLILNYAPPGVQSIVYTLSRDESFFLSNEINNDVIEGWMKAMGKE